MPWNNSAAGRTPPQPPRRTATAASMFGKREKSPTIETKEVFIPRYELAWDDLKGWLDKRFEKYNCTFTERYDVVRVDLRQLIDPDN